jgi:hypothetical protein
MKIQRSWFVAAALLLPLLFVVFGVRGDEGETTFRWDLLHFVSFTTPEFTSGGHASALANDGSKITVTGSGTFVVGEDDNVTGGGTWQTFDSGGTPTGAGTYRVTRLVRFALAPGSLSGVIDDIAPISTIRAGLVELGIQYFDNAGNPITGPNGRGFLFVSCHLVGTPNSVFEGITATMGFTDFWNRLAPVPGVDGNRTNFHILSTED